jgi:hypothetical protein
MLALSVISFLVKNMIQEPVRPQNVMYLNKKRGSGRCPNMCVNLKTHVCQKNFIDLTLKYILYIMNPAKAFWYYVTCVLFLTSHKKLLRINKNFNL